MSCQPVVLSDSVGGKHKIGYFDMFRCKYFGKHYAFCLDSELAIFVL